MPDYPNILLACPVSSVKEYCIYSWMERVKRLTYPNIEVLLVDNTPGESRTDGGNFEGELGSRGFFAYHHPNNNNLPLNAYLAECWNIIRKVVIENPQYEYHFALECDVFPDYDIIERLLFHAQHGGYQVVAAPYFHGEGKDSFLCLQQMETVGAHQMQYIEPSLSSFMATDGRLRQVGAAVLGCVLIHRSVYEKIHFHTGNVDDIHADSFFNYDLYRHGIPLMLDTSLLPDHQNRKWNF